MVVLGLLVLEDTSDAVEEQHAALEAGRTQDSEREEAPRASGRVPRGQWLDEISRRLEQAVEKEALFTLPWHLS